MPKKGFKQSAEHIKKRSEALKITGVLPSFKGRKHSQETIKKISIANRGKTPWNRGKKCPEIGRAGELSSAWRGDDVGYGAVHDWIKKTLGKPSECKNCGTKEAKRFEWANISGEYKRDVNDWLRLCTKCHHKMDGSGNHKNRPQRSIKEKYG